MTCLYLPILLYLLVSEILSYVDLDPGVNSPVAEDIVALSHPTPVIFGNISPPRNSHPI
jgi:hypothetical protein